MQDLTPVGLSKDGKRLLLVSAAGEEFAVTVDSRLRAALRGENARLSQLEMKMESALRPRDIQARLRAGESLEEVAAAAQTTVEAITGFATPVLAERAHVAQTALRASVRRRSGESSSAGRTLGEAAELFLEDHALHDDDVEWDAWRRADGRWALVAAYTVGGRPRIAEFTHDLPGRYVVAENDDARVLTGELREPDSPTSPTAGRTTSARRLSSVPSQDELPLGDDAIELVRDHRSPTAAPEPDAEAPDRGSLDLDAPEAPAASASAAPDVEDTVEVHRGTRAEPAPEGGAEGGAEEGLENGPGDATLSRSAEAEPEPAAETEAEVEAEAEAEVQAEPERKPQPKKKSRSSVPSWDEIMFGGGKSD